MLVLEIDKTKQERRTAEREMMLKNLNHIIGNYMVLSEDYTIVGIGESISGILNYSAYHLIGENVNILFEDINLTDLLEAIKKDGSPKVRITLTTPFRSRIQVEISNVRDCFAGHYEKFTTLFIDPLNIDLEQ
jgi:hypothetical protein